MLQLIERIWRLPRDLVSDGFDTALQVLQAHERRLTVSRYPSGTQCWTWIIPEKWTCEEAYLETLDGRRLFSYNENPLHVVSYSLPFDGIVERETLFRHLHTHPRLPDAIPYRFKPYERDWGLCCSQRLKDTLRDERYRVVIHTRLTKGMLKVGELVIPGATEETMVFCAHLCHPGQVNDDATGVVVGLEVMRRLCELGPLRYTYRLLILPETIGSVAWLSHHERLIPKLIGGLFLEMLGTDCPQALQLSFDGDTELDRCFLSVVRERDPSSWSGPFRRVIGNDERQFNAPGVRVPMLSLARVFHPSTGKWPYPEYHSSADTPGLVTEERLEESVALVLEMVRRWEQNLYPVNLYRGEVFCSRYGIHVDWYQDREGNEHLFDVIHHIDGSRTMLGITEACGLPFDFVLRTVQALQHHGLVRLSPTPSAPRWDEDGAGRNASGPRRPAIRRRKRP